MGPDKKKVLENFPVCKFVPGTYGENIEKLWKEFFRLYMILRKPLHSDEEINEFEIDSKNWICSFYNTNLYGKHNVTPYMHVFSQHVHQFMHQLKEKNLSLRIFSTSSIEKKNHQQTTLELKGKNKSKL
ncbi:21108_t:CDS:2 [Entrophospora sp. SA101]|nr:21108_t:CDS:2 [Entrophospora sp. SA101]